MVSKKQIHFLGETLGRPYGEKNTECFPNQCILYFYIWRSWSLMQRKQLFIQPIFTKHVLYAVYWVRPGKVQRWPRNSSWPSGAWSRPWKAILRAAGLSSSLLGPTCLFLLSSLVYGGSVSCSRRSAQGSLLSLSPCLALSLPTPTPSSLADGKGSRGNLRDSVLFVLGSMESHLHVLIATNWH